MSIDIYENLNNALKALFPRMASSSIELFYNEYYNREFEIKPDVTKV